MRKMSSYSTGEFIKVSVIVPVYNNERYLGQCLDSILSQTLTDIEVICVDDGSEDESSQILQRYMNADKRIRVITQTNSGYGKAMNIGIKAATGRFIAFVECDDYILPSMLEKLYYVAVRENCDIVKSDFYRFIYKGDKEERLYQKTAKEDKNYNRVIYPSTEKDCFRYIMNTWNGLYLRSFVLDYELFHNETPGASYQDNGFFFKSFCYCKRLYVIPEAFYMNRRDNINSSVRSEEKVYDMNREYSLIEKFLEEKDLLQKFADVFWLKRYHSYIFTLNRIAARYRHEYIRDIAEEFKNAFEKGLLIKEIYYPGEWTELMQIIRDPEEYYYNTVANRIKVSVILPVYNEEIYIRQCLDSIINQTLKDIEIICIDDGSEDGSLEVLREYEAIDNRVHVIVGDNHGAGAARNKGIEEACGRYLYFPDADDYCDLNLLSEAYMEAENRMADVTIFKSRQLDQMTGVVSECNYSLHLINLPEYRPFSLDACTGNVFRDIMGWSWDKLYRRSYIINNNILFQEQRTTNDMYFTYISLLKAERITTINKELYTQRRNVMNSLSMTRDISWECFYYALCEMRREIVEMGKWNHYQQNFIDYALHSCLANLNALSEKPARDLFKRLKDEWFKELGIIDAPIDWFTSYKEYSEYLDIINATGEFRDYENHRLRQKLEEAQIENRKMKENEKQQGGKFQDDQMINKGIESIIAERDYYKYCLNEIWNSRSFKIGRIITWIPRKLRGDYQKNEKG